jgi:hypothetical protein
MFPDLTRDDVFRLETRRLWLRWPRLADAQALVRLAGEKAVAEMTAHIPHPYGPEDAERFVYEARRSNTEGRGLALLITPRSKPEQPPSAALGSGRASGEPSSATGSARPTGGRASPRRPPTRWSTPSSPTRRAAPRGHVPGDQPGLPARAGAVRVQPPGLGAGAPSGPGRRVPGGRVRLERRTWESLKTWPARLRAPGLRARAPGRRRLELVRDGRRRSSRRTNEADGALNALRREPKPGRRSCVRPGRPCVAPGRQSLYRTFPRRGRAPRARPRRERSRSRGARLQGSRHEVPRPGQDLHPLRRRRGGLRVVPAREVHRVRRPGRRRRRRGGDVWASASTGSTPSSTTATSSTSRRRRGGHGMGRTGRGQRRGRGAEVPRRDRDPRRGRRDPSSPT